MSDQHGKGYKPMTDGARRSYDTGIPHPGSRTPQMSRTITHEGLKLTFTEDGVFITTKEPLLKKLLESAAASVGNRNIRISIEE